MGKLTSSMIDKAAHANLIAYCQGHGIELKREGKEFIIKENDSIYISADKPWLWYRHSTGEGGKAVDFAMKYLGMDFRSAVFEMLGKLPDVDIEPTAETAYKPDTATNQKRVIAYLCKRRGLDYKLVTGLIRNGKLRQDTHGNCVFIIRDKSGKAIAAELHGTGDTRFKGQATPQEGYGFEMAVGAAVKWVIYTESAIDLVSLYQMFKDKLSDTLLVSLGGIGKTSVIQNYLAIYPNAKHCLAIDNDEKADEFASRFPKLSRRRPDPQYKDWNEQLLGQ
ncbi:MAG: DUF3991 domain-containing protein [Ruminococcus sp.]|nr:DUF3991 domain-containing protein [Ruminococcus sp.]